MKDSIGIPRYKAPGMQKGDYSAEGGMKGIKGYNFRAARKPKKLKDTHLDKSSERYTK